MILTRALINAGKTASGGITKRQAIVLGTPMPAKGFPPKGWTSRLVGKEISEADYAEYVRLGKLTKEERKLDATPKLL
jgi:hypothetical protein